MTKKLKTFSKTSLTKLQIDKDPKEKQEELLSETQTGTEVKER